MKRREFIALLGGAVAIPFAHPHVARAQQPERMRRVGVLMGLPASDPGGQSETAGLNEGLRALGWIEGRNLDIHINWSGGEPVRIQAAAKELVGLGCEVLLGRSTPVVTALLKETRAIPIVFTVVVDPVGSGFVQSFARPGGNVTGFQNYEFSMVGKWAQTLLEVAPSVRRIAYFYNPTTAPAGFFAHVRVGHGFDLRAVDCGSGSESR
jgi:putative ABC transport system substrate-binding protein